MIAGLLIRQALLLAAVIDQNDEEIGQYAAIGIQALNDIIDQWSSLSVNLSYNTTITIPIKQNVYEYPVTPVISEITQASMLNNQNILFPLRIATDKEYNLMNFTAPITNPSYVYLGKQQYYTDPTNGVLGSLVYFYPLPNDTYVANLQCRMYLEEVDLFTDLSQIPAYARRYLKYLVASDCINEYGTEPSARFYTELDKAEIAFYAANPVDLSILNDNPFFRSLRMRPRSYYVG